MASLAGIKFGNRNRVLPDGKSLSVRFLLATSSQLYQNQLIFSVGCPIYIFSRGNKEQAFDDVTSARFHLRTYVSDAEATHRDPLSRLSISGISSTFVIQNTLLSMVPETAPKSVDVARHNIMHRTNCTSDEAVLLGSISLPWTPNN